MINMALNISEVNSYQQQTIHITSRRCYFHQKYKQQSQSLFENIDELSAAVIRDEITQSIKNFEPRVRLISVETFPDFDNNSFDVVITYEIIGADIPPQELQFVLQPAR